MPAAPWDKGRRGPPGPVREAACRCLLGWITLPISEREGFCVEGRCRRKNDAGLRLFTGPQRRAESPSTLVGFESLSRIGYRRHRIIRRTTVRNL
jgi:hypothetical protein